jgi:hypothetical protein
MARPQKFPELVKALDERLRQPGAVAADGRLPPEPELAEILGVARSTLRRALGELEKSGRIERRARRGTFLAGATGARAHGLLWVDDVGIDLARELWAEGRRAAEGQGWSYDLWDRRPASDVADPDFAAACDRATAIVCRADWWHGMLPILKRPQVPRLVFVGSFASDDDAAHAPGRVVRFDQRAAIELATREVLAQGHRRIAFMATTGEADPVRGWTCLPELSAWQGFQGAVAGASGVDWRVISAFPPGTQPEESAVVAAIRDQWRTLPWRPTAVVCATDWWAYQLARIAQDEGLRIPQDLSLVGMGDTPWAGRMSPRLTTVAFNVEETAQLAIAACSLPKPARTSIALVSPHLVSGASVGPAPQA